MTRHVIVEGCDGSGKSTLVNRLIDERGMVRASRASSSLMGPVPDLAQWVLRQQTIMAYPQSHLVYDRHPVVSELIYGPLIRGAVASPEFADPGWVATRKLFLEAHCLMVWCITDKATLLANAGGRQDMPGVKENILMIDHLYREKVLSWNGLAIVYNFTNPIQDFFDTYDYYQKTSS